MFLLHAQYLFLFFIIKNHFHRFMHIFYIVLQRWIIFLNIAKRIPKI